MIFPWCNGLLQISPDIPLQSALHSSTHEAEEINRLTNYFFIAAAFIMLSVIALTVLTLVKFTGSKNAGEVTVSTKWEIPMIVIPVCMVAFFFYLGVKTTASVQPQHPEKKADLVVTAHQWWWEAQYPGNDVTAVNEIHLPAGKRLLVKLLSADVIHDWWIPQFGSKKDMVPGQENYLWITVKQPGTYYGVCSEFCGKQHAHMRLKVIAQNDTDFGAWLHRQQQLPASTQHAGEKLFMTKTCGSCHRIAGTAAQGITGPDLTHVGSRKTLLAGALENTPQNLEAWIKHPQEIKPGAYMPDLLAEDSSAKAIADYLYSLK